MGGLTVGGGSIGGLFGRLWNLGSICSCCIFCSAVSFIRFSGAPRSLPLI